MPDNGKMLHDRAACVTVGQSYCTILVGNGILLMLHATLDCAAPTNAQMHTLT